MSDPSSDPQAGRKSSGPALESSPGLGAHRASVAQGPHSSPADPSLPNGNHREPSEPDRYSSTTEPGAPFQIMMGQSSISANVMMTSIATPPSSSADLRGAGRNSSVTAVEVRLRGGAPRREASHDVLHNPPDLPPFQTPPRRPTTGADIRSRSLHREQNRPRLDDSPPRPKLVDRLIDAQRHINTLTGELATSELSFRTWATLHESEARHAEVRQMHRLGGNGCSVDARFHDSTRRR